MHADEIETSVGLVRSLLQSQYPQWADLPLKRIASAGTDNVIYRLGDTLSVRLPRIHWAIDQIDKEHEWLPKLAPHLPLIIPNQLAIGEPDYGYPYRWGVYEWLGGKNSAESPPTDLNQAACDLAQFLIALRQIDTADAPRAQDVNIRGMPLYLRDDQTRSAISAIASIPQMSGMIDTKVATEIWETALAQPEPTEPAVWLHGDLLCGNVLVQDGRVSAVIDFSGLCVGDPTCDLMIAWSLLDHESRAIFRSSLGVDSATWLRGMGHALSQAVMFVPYYLETNPIGVRYAMRMLEQIFEAYGEWG